MLTQLNATEIWIKVSQNGLFMSVIRLIYLACNMNRIVNKLVLTRHLTFIMKWIMSIMTWIENIMKRISILVHVNIRLVEAHSLIEFPCFLLFPKACPFRSGLFTTTTTSSSTRFARVQDFFPVWISQIPPSCHDCFNCSEMK